MTAIFTGALQVTISILMTWMTMPGRWSTTGRNFNQETALMTRQATREPRRNYLEFQMRAPELLWKVTQPRFFLTIFQNTGSFFWSLSFNHELISKKKVKKVMFLL